MFDSVGDDPTWGGIEEEENGGGPANGGGGSRPGQGRPAPEADPNKPGASFFERIARGNNLTKMGSSSQPRAVAMQVAAQARACVDCPTLQVVGPQSTNQ